MELFIILCIPLALALVPAFVRSPRNAGIVNAAGYGLELAAVLSLARSLQGGSVSYAGFFHIDALSSFFLLVIALTTFASALYSIGYIEADLAQKRITPRKARIYYALFNLFAFSLFLVPVLDNLGILWASVEMTTLTSAFLVGFYNDKKAVEAAWKYLIICSVGITFALLGTILFYYAMSSGGGGRTLNWTYMAASAGRLDPQILKVAFLFIMVGYGTKAGLAPMHTWLPDAHSQALSPVSALLSGVVLKTSIYAILRFAVILNHSAAGPAFSSRLFVIFGVLSLAVAAGFILVQKDIKRMLAYSSIEHVGVVAVGLGVGGPLGLFGALYHVFNHAAAKSIMFFGAGNIVRAYDTHNMRKIRGVLRAMPFTGFFVIAGIFALAGMPPFPTFMSEMMILASAFRGESYLAAVATLLFLAMIFGALVHRLGRTVFGKKPGDITARAEHPAGMAAFVFLLGGVILAGGVMPGFLERMLEAAVEVIQ